MKIENLTLRKFSKKKEKKGERCWKLGILYICFSLYKKKKKKWKGNQATKEIKIKGNHEGKLNKETK